MLKDTKCQPSPFLTRRDVAQASIFCEAQHIQAGLKTQPQIHSISTAFAFIQSALLQHS